MVCHRLLGGGDVVLWAETVPKAGHDLMSAHGVLSLATTARLRMLLLKRLADRGAVVLDLTDVSLEWRPAVEVFPTVLSAAGGWPAARLVLAAAGPALTVALLQLRVDRSVPLVRDRAAAVERIGRRPDLVMRHTTLPAGSAPDATRRVVRNTCAEWGVDPTADAAAALASELVANAGRHTRGICRLSLRLDDRGLRVAVRDYAPGPPQPVQATVGTSGGLPAVAGLADIWGVREHPDGRTVWALIRPPAGSMSA